MIGLSNTAGQFFTFYLILFLLGFAGSSAGLLLGSIITDPKIVSTLISIVFLPVMVFSGFYKNTGDLPQWISWIQYFSPMKYGFIGLVDNEVLHTDSLISNMNFDVGLWPSLAALFGISIGCRLLALFFLWFLKKKVQ